MNNDKGATPRVHEQFYTWGGGDISLREHHYALRDLAYTIERELTETKSALIGARVLIEELRAAHEASQARAARLEEALKGATHALRSYQYGNEATALARSQADANETALAESPNSWLQERLKAERERAAKVCENEELTEDLGDPGDDVYNQAVQDCAAAIRALPEGE